MNASIVYLLYIATVNSQTNNQTEGYQEFKTEEECNEAMGSYRPLRDMARRLLRHYPADWQIEKLYNQTESDINSNRLSDASYKIK